ncbi:hypothetical protein ABEB36_011601 [Hypothenemus hampei]|uniref:Peptidase S1 domain-containing protein n=1 Tax=Hypothenemus hampei TaxID=57062 RepID=A0ABD1E8E0_HYPHA
MLAWWLVAVVTFLIGAVTGRLESPCSEVFKYDTESVDEPNQWNGVLTIGTDEDLEGIWIKIYLDRRAAVLGNWFAESTTVDHKEFSIRNSNYKLAAGPPIQIEFFVKYDSSEQEIPRVKKITLNGRTICPKPVRVASAEPKLHISVAKPLNSDSSETGHHKNGYDSYNTDTDSNQYHSKSKTSNKGSSSSTSTTTTTTERYQYQQTERHRNKNAQETSDRDRKQPLYGTSSSDDDDNIYLGDFHFIQNKKPTSRPLSSTSRSAQCGTVAQRAAPFILNGEDTSPGQWPWHVALYVSYEAELKYNCGGTLISESHVITAAHCVTKPRTTDVISKDKILVYLGKYRLNSFNSEVQDRQVDSFIVHPDYNASFLYNDIAIIKLSSPVEVNNYVRPCCLWDEQDTNFDNIVGKLGTVVGWGFNDKGEISKTLTKADLPIVSTTKCLFSNRPFYSQFLYDKNFCAGFKNGR